jgi:hypothetical protein
LSQDLKGVLGGLARVDDQGQLTLLRKANVRPKALSLPVHVFNASAVQAVIIQTRLANANHFAPVHACSEVLHAGLLNLILIGVNAQGAPKIVIGLSQALDRVKGLQFRADDQSPVDLRFVHVLTDLIHQGLKLGVIQMTVRVDKHGDQDPLKN